MRSIVFRLATVLGAALLITVPAPSYAANGDWTLIGWNNLGMHCMDDDYSVFSILPPYNTINAQLIDGNGNLVLSPAGIEITYEAVKSGPRAINSTSVGKTNFWTFAPALFGVTLLPDMGLAGFGMPGLANTPQAMQFDATLGVWSAVGIPITPLTDRGRTLEYPMMRLSARDASGTVLATTKIVLPVSSELNCRACHLANSSPAAKPSAGWVTDPNPSREYRLNILRLHDQRNARKALYAEALANFGYQAAGLYSTATAGTPILCAKCHASEALGTAGFKAISPLTAAIHSRHASVSDPKTNQPLDSSSNRSACYLCHPGATTRCLRGVMGKAMTADGSMKMQCQSCHGNMSAVGSPDRTGWLDEPNCQACHTGDAVTNSGHIRFTSALLASGSLREPVNQRFATNPDVPAPGKSLFRFSVGHGGLQCEACHGSTHAEFPSAQKNDNVQSKMLQGHRGVLAECKACHNQMPVTTSGGPHGMHSAGAVWVTQHQSVVARSGAASCKACHGTTYRGTGLSKMFATRVLAGRTFKKGTVISCYSCHDGPNGGGMHAVGQKWVDAHEDVAERGTSSCQRCHGTDYRGTDASRMLATRVMAGRTFTKGTVIGCYTCHNGPSGGDDD